MSKKDKKTDKKNIIPSDDMVTRIIGDDNTSVSGRVVDLFKLSDEELQNAVEQPDWSRLEGSFSDLKLIGMGGMGTVFAAKDSLFYRNVALKIMRNELRNQSKNVNSFIREARITAQIDHPNIIPVYNLGVFKEMGPYFSMKKVDGITLAEVLKKLEQNDAEYEKNYSLRHRLEIFINICNGVAFAHSKGVFHCDLKPGNIMLGNYGEVFIMDWGMAIYRSEKDCSAENRKIRLGEKNDGTDGNVSNPVINGTPAYMAPEQIFGKFDSIDEQTDVYALGVILYALLTCTQSPFPPRLPAEEIFNRALAGEFLPPRKRAKKRQISNELEVVCLKAMSPYKHERYADVKSLMQDIRNILDMHPVEVYNSPISNFIKYCRRHPMIPTAFLGALITLAVFYSYFSLSNMFNARTLYQVLTLTVDESIPLFSRIRMELKRNDESVKNNQGFEPDFDENHDFEIKSTTAKLALSCTQTLEALENINELTFNPKYLPKITDALEFCINYSLLTNNSVNIQKILNFDSGLVYNAYKKIIRKNPKLRRQLYLLSLNSGELVFNTPDDTLEIFISKQPDRDVDTVEDAAEIPEKVNSELLLKKGSFKITLRQGTYSLLVSDTQNRNITLPVQLNAGETDEIDFEFPTRIPDNCVYVHKGYYYSNIQHYSSHGRHSYTDSYFLLDREVTIGEYLEFFKTLKSDGEKQKYNPDLLFHEDGRFSLRKLFGKNYEILPPYSKDMPLVGISVEGANAYCRYISKKIGMKCRLPYFMEMEKAARGTGRRLYVWGSRFNPDYALLAGNPAIKSYPYGAPPKSFMHDYSLYGVYDLTGNVRELVQLRKNMDYYVLYGGSYRNTANYAKCGTLSRFAENRTDVGMRYVVELPQVRKVAEAKEKVEKKDL